MNFKTKCTKRCKKLSEHYFRCYRVMSILTPILNWYQQNKRDLPWRDTHDPYLIWLSEIILQQTRVEQGLPYYQKFSSQYPNVVALANANDDEVMKLWQGLGYYNRAANMLKTARIIKDECGGKFPDTYQELIKLKGIGPYTAAAIASFAFNEAHAVVDGNVYRVLARLFAISEPINSTQGKKIFAELAQDLLDKKFPAIHNQAIMEIGATVCKPKQAQCESCVLRLQCEAYKKELVYSLPVKDKKRKPINRFLNYLFIETPEAETYIRQRTDEGIWNKLYEFPLIETATPIEYVDELYTTETWHKLFGDKKLELQLAFQTKHQLSHQTLFANFWVIRGKSVNLNPQLDFIKIKTNAIHEFAVPRLLERFLNTILP